MKNIIETSDRTEKIIIKIQQKVEGKKGQRQNSINIQKMEFKQNIKYDTYQ